MTPPAVTVIVPVFNTADFLEAALTSVLAQSLSEIEVICVDDGSTDESPAILARYAELDGRIRVVRQDNGGVGAARNTGMRHATGDYLYFFDSDDILVPDALSSLHTRARDTGSQIVYFDAVAFTDDAGLDAEIARMSAYYDRAGASTAPASGQALYRRLTEERAWRPSPCLQFYERDWFVERGLTFPVGVLHEDNLFSVQVAIAADRVVHLPEKLFHRRVRANSITTTRKTLAHVHGLAFSARGLGRLLATADVELETREALRMSIRDLHLRAIEAYQSLGADRRDQVMAVSSLDPDDAALLPLYDRIISERRQAANTDAQLRAVLNSRSFRLASIPRRAVRALRGGKSAPPPA